MSQVKKIAVIDSGIGGLALLKRIEFLPYQYLYIADNAFMPYGDKGSAQLKERAKLLTEYAVKQFDADCIIIACNTLTACAYSTLKRLYPDRIFVGCEPPIKQCLEYTASNVLMVCTPYTANYYQNLHLANVKVQPLPQLATMVENGVSDKQIKQYIESNLCVDNCDCIALGCTHYSHVKHCFEQLYPCIKVFDSVDGAIARLRKTVLKPNRNKKNNLHSSVEFYFTDNSANLIDSYQAILANH